MKRNRIAVRQSRHTRTQSGQSKYKAKRDSGKMMYGPGCCAHTVTDSQISAARRRARDNGISYIAPYEPIAQRRLGFEDL